jgi:hypothetical protein
MPKTDRDQNAPQSTYNQKREKLLYQILADCGFAGLVDVMWELANGVGSSPHDFVNIRVTASGLGTIEVSNYKTSTCLSRTHFNYPEDFE